MTITAETIVTAIFITSYKIYQPKIKELKADISISLLGNQRILLLNILYHFG